jgi:uncharacterized membrane protein YeaQ/YmgE (transglycosylase-associated protein family)
MSESCLKQHGKAVILNIQIGENKMNFIIWLIVGAIVGWVANSLMGNREGLLVNIIVGIVGAFVAGLVLTPLLGIGTINQSNFSLPAMLVSVGGAIILLVVLNVFRRQGGFRFR